MRRRWFAIIFSVASVLLVSFFLLLNGSKEAFRVNYDKIQMGMTIEEVEGVLGKPTIATSFYSDGKKFRDSYTWKFSDDGVQNERPSIQIGFAKGHAVDKTYVNRTTWDALKSAIWTARRALGV